MDFAFVKTNNCCKIYNTVWMTIFVRIPQDILWIGIQENVNRAILIAKHAMMKIFANSAMLGSI